MKNQHHRTPFYLSKAARKRSSAIQPRRLTLEMLETRTLLSVIPVTVATDSGPGSFRQAILDANASPGQDVIEFSIGDGGQQTLQPLSALPRIDDSVVIDGWSQPGFSGTPLIELDGRLAGDVTDGLRIETDSTTVRGLVINRFGGNAIVINSGVGNVVQGNFIGVDWTGTVPAGNGGDGVRMTGAAAFNLIGTDADGVADTRERNVISGNGLNGVEILGLNTNNNTVAGNFIGIDFTGGVALGNGGDGVAIVSGSYENMIGGGTAAARNVISNNGAEGVDISGDLAGADSHDNFVMGNYIGTDATGTISMGNQLDGVRVRVASTRNTIGTNGDGVADENEGNVISGNLESGVFLHWSGTDYNVIAGNFVGTDASGTIDLGNGLVGVRVGGGSVNYNRVGTNGDGISDELERNVISGNAASGVGIAANGSEYSMFNVVAGNFIGTDVTGSLPLPNDKDGVIVWINAQSNQIGTNGDGVSDEIEGNVISGNLRNGIHITGANVTDNSVRGNFIGTDATGTFAVANAGNGIAVGDGAHHNQIGAASPAEGNLISGNRGDGIMLFGSDVTRNVIQGNLIGTDVSGTAAVGNRGDGINIDQADANFIGDNDYARNVISGNLGNGVAIVNGATRNQIFGNSIGTQGDGISPLGNAEAGVYIDGDNNKISNGRAGNENTIAYQGGGGVIVVGGNRNTIRGNAIFANVGLAIDLGDDGPTANDPSDTDTGPNLRQNYPELRWAVADFLRVSGRLQSLPDTNYVIDIYAGDPAVEWGPEAKRHLGWTSASTDSTGIAYFEMELESAIPSGNLLVATATDASGNTSELSPPIVAARPSSDGTVFVDADALGTATGEKWEDAIPSLQTALEVAEALNADNDGENNVTAIWIADGVYQPTVPSVPGESRTGTFKLVSGVSLYGGFAGGEGALDEREQSSEGTWLHETVLSGDVLANDDLANESTYGDNAYTVVYASELVEAVDIDAITISGGYADGEYNQDHPEWAEGGGLYVYQSNVTVCRSMVNGNTADYGGGIFSYGPDNTLTVVNSTVSGNTASSGGAFYSHGTLTVANSTLSDNAASSGGAIFSSFGSQAVLDGSVIGNTATYGGGIRISFGGSLTVADSTVIGNTASDGGGFDNYGELTVLNSTVSGNTASRGGGFYSNYGSLAVTNSTVTGNAASEGGGIKIGSSSSATINNSIVAGSTCTSYGPDVYGTIAAHHTLIGDGSAMSGVVHGADGNLVGTLASPIDPKFTRAPWDGGDGWGDDPNTPAVDEGANDDYGDLRLLVGSPAFNSGRDDLAVDAVGTPLATDLAGQPRILDRRVDMGAYELAAWHAAVDAVQVIFDDPIEPSSFSIDEDVKSFLGPEGTISVLDHRWIDDRTLELAFRLQYVTGSYEMIIGPEILTVGGDPMLRPHTVAFVILGPQVEQQFPSGVVAEPIDSVRLDFTKPMDRTSFSPEEDLIRFEGPGGPLVVQGYRWSSDGHTLEIAIEPQASVGNCEIALGTQIRDQWGNHLDQDGDLVVGEVPEDRYEGSFGITGARIDSHTPVRTGILITQVVLSFDQPMDGNSFSLQEDIARFSGPDGIIEVTDYRWLDNRRLELSFDQQTTIGTYEIVIGPEILNTAGIAMDQDRDFVPGEPESDQYTASLALEPGSFITEDTVWRAIDPPIILEESVAVAPWATLTIEAGSTLKFSNGAGLYVGGNLDVQGTVDAPVILTSYRDDDAGGDTNNDGDATGPIANDWGGITFADSATGTLENVEVRYASYAVNANAEYAKVTMRNAVLRDGRFGVYVYSPYAEIEAENCLIADNQKTGIFMRASSSGVYRNCTIVGNGFGGSDSEGAGIHVGGANLTLDSSIVAFNPQYGLHHTGDPALVTLRNSDFHNPGGQNIAWNGDPGMPQLDQDGNTTDDPLFVDRSAGN